MQLKGYDSGTSYSIKVNNYLRIIPLQIHAKRLFKKLILLYYIQIDTKNKLLVSDYLTIYLFFSLLKSTPTTNDRQVIIQKTNCFLLCLEV
jgi:hypothetical protein